MTLQQLHYVITISETGSMNSAAELLYVAQPSPYGAVKELEKELGITIFHRSGRRVSLTNEGLEFITLTECDAYVYMWKGHPLADKESVSFNELKDYPCLSFEQGSEASFYFAEEIFSTNEYPRTVKATDRATMLNLMVGLNGYTLCSGIICEELNGSDYIAVPLETEEEENGKMEIGYIVKKNTALSTVGELYIKELREYLS